MHSGGWHHSNLSGGPDSSALNMQTLLRRIKFVNKFLLVATG
jgi:hypothetical protein